ncbi:ABC transporter related protein [Methanocaldococcus infernus ME]|uniref:Molybdate/tungstate import ATP-binding protein WtpC n=1 Tax=Methanocaldococcus infernus (strain DSM 11812 / JCM 15783 / ME) TaxID=573063 RepID=D5VQJ7_METIM|nr:ATP-binding cassette domain-containing protein [Methanocaldococcus infernus]ADG12850.1 ABC transporter related protein [Methanocaldococcus infernus ME]
MLEVINLKKRLAHFTLSIDHLKINKNDYFVLLGLSGSGKTTFLEILAGFRKLDEGKIILNGEDITEKPINKRKIVMCHGKYLFPHLTVFDNIGFGIRDKKVREKKVREVSEALGISHLLNRKPETLSSGEQQRVALARALVLEPEVILLDEPLNALDRLNHEALISELKNIHESSEITFIHVTHDFIEALALSNKIAIIREGRIEQFGETEEVIKHPKNEFVAKFVGYKNFLKGKVREEDGKIVFDGDLCITLEKNEVKDNNGLLAIRPEDIILVGNGGGCRFYKKDNIFNAKVLDVYPLSLSTVRVILDVDGTKLYSEVIRSKAYRMNLRRGKEVKICISRAVLI